MAKMRFNFLTLLNIILLMIFVVQNLDVGVAYTMKVKYKSSVFQFHAQFSVKLAKTVQSKRFLQPKFREVCYFRTLPRKEWRTTWLLMS